MALCGLPPNLAQRSIRAVDGIVVRDRDVPGILCLGLRLRAVGFAEIIVPVWTALQKQERE